MHVHLDRMPSRLVPLYSLVSSGDIALHYEETLPDYPHFTPDLCAQQIAIGTAYKDALRHGALRLLASGKQRGELFVVENQIVRVATRPVLEDYLRVSVDAALRVNGYSLRPGVAAMLEDFTATEN